MTPAQKRIVDKISAGCELVCGADVLGQWWWLRPTGESVRRPTAEALARKKVIVPGEEKEMRGHCECVWSLAHGASAGTSNAV